MKHTISTYRTVSGGHAIREHDNYETIHVMWSGQSPAGHHVTVTYEGNSLTLPTHWQIT